MAQVLYYWNCRVEGAGQHSYQSDYGTESANFATANYQWSDMDTISGDNENALLIYNCGVSVNMDYGTSSSSATTSDAVSAFENYFGFKSQADYKQRIWHPFDWKSILKANLNYGWPIIYRGQDDALSEPEDAHAWVIDGYDSEDYFHCNWGWDGTSNNWYSLGGFNPLTYDYNEYQAAVTDIEPIRTAGIEMPVLSPQTFTYNSNGYNLTIPEVEGASSYEWSTNHGTITGSGTTANLKSDCSATVQVRAFNDQCEIYSSYATTVFTIDYGLISGPSLVCSSGATFTINNFPPVNSIVWTPGPGLTISSGQNTASCTFSATGNVISWVKAMLVLDCGNITLTPKEIIAGSVRPGTISYEMDAPPGRFSTFIDDVPTATSYNWYLNGVKNNTYHGTSAVFPRKSPFCGVSYRVEVEAINPCGTSGKTLLDIFEPSCFYSLLLSPNPTTTESTLELFNESDAIMESDMEWDLEVYSPNQLLKMKKLKLKGKAYKINTSGWEDGVFIVRVKIDDQVLSEKLVVKH